MLGRLASIIAKELLSGQHIVRAAAGDAQSCLGLAGFGAGCLLGRLLVWPSNRARVRARSAGSGPAARRVVARGLGAARRPALAAETLKPCPRRPLWR
jgi:hypothetical protein